MPIFGDNTVGGDSFPMSDGRAIASLFTLTEAATVVAIWANFTAGTTAGASMKGLVMANASNTPSTVLIVSSATAIPAGGGWVSCTASGSLSAGNYFVGLVTNDGGGHSSLSEDSSGGTTDMANGTFDYASPPSTWPGTTVDYATQVNCYVEYTTAGGATTFVPVRRFPNSILLH